MSGKEGGSSMEGQMRTRKGASTGGEREGRKDRWMDQWVEYRSNAGCLGRDGNAGGKGRQRENE